MQKINTLRLLKKIEENTLNGLIALGANLVFMLRIVSACVLNNKHQISA